MRWALLSGQRGSDKSGTARRLVASLRARGLGVAGFTQRRLPSPEGEMKRYLLERIGSLEQVVLADEGLGGATQESHCTHAFAGSAFELALGWLQEDAPAAQVLVLDDVSKLETQGRGHAAAVRWALAQPGKTVLLCVRAKQLFYVMENFGIQDAPLDALELPADAAEEARFASSIADAATAT